MHFVRTFLRTAAVGLSLLTVACTETATAPDTRASTALSEGVTPMCELGCTETDPYPTANGLFLGSGVTPTVCFGDEHTDLDADILSDFCEKNLAQAFAPELYYHFYDEVGREPYWLAEPRPFGTVRRISTMDPVGRSVSGPQARSGVGYLILSAEPPAKATAVSSGRWISNRGLIACHQLRALVFRSAGRSLA